jgi:hypothetical protein
MPDQLDGLSFGIQFRRTPMRVTVASGTLTVTLSPEGASRPIAIGFADEVREACPGERHTFELPQTGRAGRQHEPD